MLKIIWLLASGYLIFNLFRPLPPFKRRRWIFFWLLVVQAVSFGGYAAQVGAQDDAPKAQPSSPHAAQAPNAPEPDIDKFIVHTDANAPDKPPSAAGLKDAKAAKEEVRAMMPDVDASVLLLKHGVAVGDSFEVERVSEAMHGMEMKLDSRTSSVGTENWPERDYDSYHDCSAAADHLAEYADSLAKPNTVQSVRARLDLQDQFHGSYAKCKAWLGHW